MSDQSAGQHTFSLSSGSLSGEDETEGHAKLARPAEGADGSGAWSKGDDEADDTEGHTVISGHAKDPKR